MPKPHVLVSIALGPTCFVLGALLSSEPDSAPRHAPPPATRADEPVRSAGSNFAVASSASGPNPKAPRAADSSSATSTPQLVPEARAQPVAVTPIHLAADPQRATLYAALARRSHELGFDDDAIRFREAALAAGPANASVLESVLEDDPGAYALALRRALDLDPTNAKLLDALVELDPAEAVRRAKLLLANVPTDSSALRLLIEHDLAAARTALRAALAHDPTDGETRELFAEHVPSEAWPLLVESLGADPSDYALLYDATLAAKGLGQPAQAAQLLESGLEGIHDPSARLDLITLLATVDPAGAIRHYEAESLPFSDPYDGYALVAAYARTGRMQDAVALAQRLVNLEYANDGMSYLTLSLMSLDGDSSDLGLQLAMRLAERDPSDQDTRERILSALSERELIHQRRAVAQRWIQHAARADEVYWLGNYFDDEQPDLAISALKKAHALDPSDHGVLIDLARIAPEPALEALAQPLGRAPLDGTLRRALKIALETLAADAPGTVLGWLDRFPADPLHRNPESLHLLADLCAQGDSAAARAAARALYQRAQQLDPDEDRATRIAELGR